MKRNLPKISVETIGYYHADSELNTIPNLLPKRLNDNKRFFENPHIDIPFIDLDITLPPMPMEKEYNLKSLLNYLSQKGWPNGDLPDFVTHKNLLQKVASRYEETEIYVVKMNGVIYMYKNNEMESRLANFLLVFQHHLTRKTEDEPFETDGTVRKGVFRASIDMGDGNRENILYNGKIDLVDDNEQHNEVKVVTVDNRNSANSFFWGDRSNRFYWQSFFGNSTHLLLGMRTGEQGKDPKTRPPKHLPPLSVFKVRKMSLTKLYKRAEANLKMFPHRKQINDGYEDIRRLLSLIRENVKNDGDGFVFSRYEGDDEWTIRRDDKAVADFKTDISNNIPN